MREDAGSNLSSVLREPPAVVQRDPRSWSHLVLCQAGSGWGKSAVLFLLRAGSSGEGSLILKIKIPKAVLGQW